MTTNGDKLPGDPYSEAWYARVAAWLAANEAEEQRLWGGIDEMMLARYEAGVSTDEERARVEQAIQDFPALRESIEISRELSAEWQETVALPLQAEMPPARSATQHLPALRSPKLPASLSPTRPLTIQPRPWLRPPMLRDSRVAIGAACGGVVATLMMALFAGPDHLKQRFNEIIVPLFKANVVPPKDQAERSDKLAVMAAALTRGKDDRPILYQGDRTVIEAFQLARQQVTLGHDNLDPAILDLAMRARTPDDTLGLLVPAYFDPLSEDWKKGWEGIFRARANKLEVIAIMKVEVNAGFRNDRRFPIFVEAIREAHNQKVRVVAYIDLLGGRPDATLLDTKHKLEVAAKILLLRDLFPIDGVFLDNQPTDPQLVPVFNEIKASVRQKNPSLIVISSPRQPCPREYLSIDNKDIIVQAYSDRDPILYDPPEWVAAYPPDKFAGSFWGLRDPASLPLQLRHAAARHLGWIYISDSDTYNPDNHKSLPPHWNEEVSELRRLNEAIKSGVEPRG